MVIYYHFTIITQVMLLYNTERWYDDGIAVNYRGKKFYIIGTWCLLRWLDLNPRSLNDEETILPLSYCAVVSARLL